MNKKSDIEKFDQISKDDLAESDFKSMNFLFSNNENNQKFKKYVYNEFLDYLNNNTEADFNLSSILDKIHHVIHKKENLPQRQILRRIYNCYSKIAAVLLIPLLIAAGFWILGQKSEDNIPIEKPVTTTLFAPLGSRISFNLPDGTEGWLNSGSTLEYQIPFNGNRQVSLFGEAWFHVAKDEIHPFVLKAGKSNVKVLGTKFNINAYPDENYVEVVLEEGKVEFSAPGVISAIEMSPDERLFYTSDSIKIDFTDTFKYSAWREGKLVFRGDRMKEVARRIERWYNVKVELADDELENYVFRGTFQDDSLEEVFRCLAMTSPIKYRIIDRSITGDDTFERTKVVLYKKRF